ncbi:MAG TPA: alcohol dehydrogenase catalytic domain-containing protein [Nitrososphaerales archaeon]|nr:alcohol dehydrogenase catalytic domain-containing protein [Nitrososphaerales archaeon]
MKAVAKTRREPGLEVIESDPDRISDNEVLIRMRAASICGSDLGFYNYTPAYEKFAKVPTIMGHEFAGEIAEVGKNVHDFNIGDRVSVESVLYCGSCKFCRQGATNICRNFTVFGMHRNGGFAEFVAVDQKYLHRIPGSVSFLEAGVVEPLSVVVNALEDVSAQINVGETACVIGPGPLGLFSAEILRAKGASNPLILGIGIDEYRLGLARTNLSYETMDTEKVDPAEKMNSMTDGYGFDVVVVAAGAPAALRSAVPLVSKGGQIIVIGIFPEDVSLPASDLVRRQISMRGSYGSAWKHYEEAIHLLNNKMVRADAIVSHQFDLDHADEAFQMAKAKTGSKVQFKN